MVGSLIIDEDGVYNVVSPNDRLLLGMNGTMSEMELSVFRQRSIEATKQKARRGELFLTVAVGYVKADGDRIEKDSDRRVQEAVELVFRKFAELQTIRQVLVWCRQERRWFCPPWARHRAPDGFQTGDGGVENLASLERPKSVAESHQRGKVRRRNRSRVRNQIRRLIHAVTQIQP